MSQAGSDPLLPLLAARGLPRFDLVRADQVEASIRALLSDLVIDLEAERVAHLDISEKAWRTAHDAVQPEVVRFSLRLGQSREIYSGLEALRDGPHWAGLDAAQQRIVERLLLTARLAGVGLTGTARERFNQIQTELAELGTRFANNVLDATKAWTLTLRSGDEVAGLPRSLLELAAQAAREAGETDATPDGGPWRITLDEPSFFPFMQHARRRDLRERVYRARVSLASSGELDNAPLLGRILSLRREEAELLGYTSFAELSLATKMAPDVAAVTQLLEELYEASSEAARRDLAELRDTAAAHRELETSDRGSEAPAPELAHWDVPFWAERLREDRFAYTDEPLRP